MKRFRIVADATFEAENIDHAFEVMARHFADLAVTLAAEDIVGYPATLTSGSIDIRPEQS